MSLAIAGLIVAAAPACSKETTPEATSTVTVTASDTTTSPRPTESTPRTTQADGYQGTLLPVRETHGTTSVNVQLPQVTGGAAAVRDTFNSGMRAALDQMVSSGADTTIEDGSLPGNERSEVTTITPHVIAGVAVFNWYTKGAAHPNNSVATVATNVDTAAPILLSDVFTDQQAAAERLTQAVLEINRSVGPLDPPSIDNFLNWVPIQRGFRVYVPVSHAAGDYWPVTVPWDRISDLMTPAMRTTLIS